MRAIAIVMRYLWASPATLVGLSFAGLALCAGATGRMVDGVLEVAGGRLERIIARFPHVARFCAITFGHVIIGTDHDVLQGARSHEHVHVRQYERWGVLFFPVYLGSSLFQLLRGRDPYLNNCFEREAFARCNDPRFRRYSFDKSRMEKVTGMLELRPSCENCDRDLPPASEDALICSFECTFCRECASSVLAHRCPNCGGELLARPRRPAEKLAKFPASTARVFKPRAG